MKLSKRLATIILPALIISYLLPAFGLFFWQKKIITDQEQEDFQRLSSEAVALYKDYEQQARSMLYSISSSETLQDFFFDTNERYREILLANGLERNLTYFSPLRSDFTAFAIAKHDGELLYYYESSLDPFASISEEHQAFITELKGKPRTELRFEKENQLRIISGSLLDPRTFTAPLASQKDQAVSLTLYFDPQFFDQQLQQIKAKFDAEVHFRPIAQNAHYDSALFLYHAPLNEQLELVISVPESYLPPKLSPLRESVAIGFITLVMLTYGLLRLLLHRLMVRPIEKLAKDIAVLGPAGEGHFIPLEGKDEISRLSQRFSQLLSSLTSAYEEVRQLAYVDPLTKLPNRTHFLQELSQAIRNYPQTHESFSVLYLDLDNFKYVNDRFGHDMGDSLLSTFAQRLNERLTSHLGSNTNYVLARLAGDEFAILLKQVSHTQDLIEIGEDILSLFSSGFRVESCSFPISVSVGIARFPKDGTESSELIQHADYAMYQAKSHGKCQYAFYSGDMAKTHSRMRDIEEGLKEEQFLSQLKIQMVPTCDSQKNLTGYRAKCHWLSPELGKVGPGEFLPVAESLNLFETIDRWLLQEALPLFAEEAKENRQLRIGLRLSSAELQNHPLMNDLLSQVEALDIRPEQLVIILSGELLHPQTENMRSKVSHLRKLGFSVALGQFGKGQTSLMQLIDLPITHLALDHDFVGWLLPSDKVHILPALIAFCHSQDIQVICYGVDEDWQFEQLVKAGCDHFAGRCSIEESNLSAHQASHNT